MNTMSKDRLAAFFDAVLAIIMTVLVLNLEKPEQLNIWGLLNLAPNLFAYTLSFFWLGFIWMGIHRTWQDVEKISEETVVSTLVLLFFSSFFPYTTNIVSGNFNDLFAQLLYGFISLMVTISVSWNYASLSRADRENQALESTIVTYRYSLRKDIAIKVLGFVIAVVVYPPDVMYSILFAALAIMVPSRFFDTRIKRR